MHTGMSRIESGCGHFHCAEPEKMYYNVLKDRVSYFKKTKEGEAIMCRAIEEMRNQEREEGRLEGKIEGKTETMISLVRDGLIAVSEAAKRMQLSESEFKSLMEQHH